MHGITEAQAASEKKLNRQGFNFSNWIPASPDANCQPTKGSENPGTLVMKRRPNRYTTEYREIDPDGTINLIGIIMG